MSNLLKLTLLSLITLSAHAQLILHEPFDLGPGVQILGNENGWQADFNDPGPSVVPVQKRNAHKASPFSSRGYAIQPANSRMTCYRKLPTALNGKNVFFSYCLKAYSHENVSAFRFRSSDGSPINIGFIRGLFSVEANSGLQTGEQIELKQDYFIVGQIQFSADGKEIGVAAKAYTSPNQVGNTAPATTAEWPLLLTYTYGKEKTWDGVAFRSASANTVFDDLRIGNSWSDVTGKQAPQL